MKTLRFIETKLVQKELDLINEKRAQLKREQSTLRVQAWRLKNMIEALHQLDLPLQAVPNE